jgi:hypothetical protein
LKPALHVGGKVVALDGKAPHVQLVVELVRPAGSETDFTLSSAAASRIESSRPRTGNRVLRLSGTNSFVELPPRVFEHLNESTIEVWVKWNVIRGLAPAYTYGEDGRDAFLGAPAVFGSHISFAAWEDRGRGDWG